MSRTKKHTRHSRHNVLGAMDRKELLKALERSLQTNNANVVDVFKALEHKHGGLDERDISPNMMRKLIRAVLKRELEADHSPTVFVALLVMACRREKTSFQVDMLISHGGFASYSMETIPYTIAKSKLSTERKLVWVKAIVGNDELAECFDLNRPVAQEGNIVVNSYATLHIHDIEWYEYLLLDLRLAVNTKVRHKTLKEFILRDVDRGRAPKCARKLLDLLDHCGGKTNVELKQ